MISVIDRGSLLPFPKLNFHKRDISCLITFNIYVRDKGAANDSSGPGPWPSQARESVLTVPSMSQPVLIRLVLNQARKAELELDTEHQGTEHLLLGPCLYGF